MKKYFTIVLLLSFYLCVAQNRFSNDVTLRAIYNFEYERYSDSLVSFFNHENVKYRYAAIQAVSSVQDTSQTKQLLQMLSLENVDSIRLALITSLSQLDCKASFDGLNDYYQRHKNEKASWACIEAIGKISKNEVTDFFIQSFDAQQKHEDMFVKYWLKGLYLAKRRNNIDLKKFNSKLESNLQFLLEHQSGLASELNYYYARIIQQAQVESPSILKTKLEELKPIEESLRTLKTPYLQIEELKKYILSAKTCRDILHSNLHTLLKRYALDEYLKNHTWNNKIDHVFIESIFDQMDVSLISGICEYIVTQNEIAKPIDINLDVLRNLQRQLMLPRDFETWIDIEKAILSFEGKKYTYKSCFETGYQNPIDWNYIIKIDAQQKVKVTTNKGVMIFLLKVNEAPASVANFLKLVDVGYYNGKYFHRVVKNFVVQGGCPRGDGWGSLDWNQRSELSGNLKYKKGSVGLASVGKDSEGVQFFICHTFAPHLEGRYTLFAEVIKGFDVMENLLVGDEIIKIERI
jgi:cyclophilin family peptidyl-prolyl cis-trans isomerase